MARATAARLDPAVWPDIAPYVFPLRRVTAGLDHEIVIDRAGDLSRRLAL